MYDVLFVCMWVIGLLKKRFGTDFTFKDSFMWIDLRSLSLHW